MALRFIDVSAHNGNVDFNKVKSAGYDGVIIRAGFGKVVTQVDKCFETNYKNAKAVGLKVGAYWYSYATTTDEAILEAKACLEVVKNKQFDFPIYFDIEDKCQFGLNKTKCTNITNAFCGEMEKNKCWVGVYSFDSFFSSHLDITIQKRYAVWVACIDGKVPKFCKTYQGHQYSWTGHITGHSCDFDVNTFTVDYSPLIKQRGLNGYGEVKQAGIISPYKGKFRISQQFKGAEHQGLDLVGIDSKSLYATVDGTVEISGFNDPNGFGTYVRIHGKDGNLYYYGHMSSTAVKVGAEVKCGDYIGEEGSTGRSTGSHCHYEIRKSMNKTSYLDVCEMSGIPNAIGTYTDNSPKTKQNRLVINAGTWNVRQSPNTAGKVVAVVNGGAVYSYSATMNGWAYITEFKAWISPKGYTIK